LIDLAYGYGYGYGYGNLISPGEAFSHEATLQAPRTAQIQVTVGPVKEGGGEEKHTIIANRILMIIRVKMDMQSDTVTWNSV